ncbi:hypothetical protein GCM10027405_26320 [Arthrobacter alkaliphilus]|uniref:hypothetical protein n=1 Tax=Arthrobacter alkaliphilus TaxID=369936 RepID=UPI001F306D7C|nr:hypothetical protein [Arthrobacter alkaliphilus]
MKYYKIEPTVDGSHGEFSEFDPLSNKRRLLRFHLVLEDWFGEDIVTMAPGFAVTRRLANSLSESGLTGFELRDMYLSISTDGTEAMIRKGAQIPDLVWLDLVGEYGQADFFLDRVIPDMIVSERALGLLRQFKLGDANIEDHMVR